MECTYEFLTDIVPDLKGKLTYRELVESIDWENITDDNVYDIVYSKSEGEIKQDKAVEIIENTRSQGTTNQIIIPSATNYDIEESIFQQNNSVHILNFINTPDFKYRPDIKISQFNTDNFRDYTVEGLKMDNIPQDQAILMTNQIINNWGIVGKDAQTLHKAISHFNFQKSRSEFKTYLTNIDQRFTPVANELYDSAQSFMAKALGNIKRKAGGSCRVFHNLNFTAPSSELSYDLFGHIDMLVIDALGNAHIFNYKVTTSNIDTRSAKFQTYLYQMAFLKRMLASKGIDVQNITLNIVPIKVRYKQPNSPSEPLENFNSIIIDSNYKDVQYNDSGRYVITKQDTIASHFISAPLHLEKINNEDTDEVDRQLKLIFPDLEVKSTGILLTVDEWIRKHRKSSIFESNDPNYSYVIEFENGIRAFIKSSDPPESNMEIKEAVIKHTSELTKVNLAATKIIDRLKGVMKTGKDSFKGDSIFDDIIFVNSQYYLNTIFGKYIPNTPEEAEWEIQENYLLNQNGIILFKNKNTNQVDIVSISPWDLDARLKFKKSSEHILGGLLTTTGLNNSRYLTNVQSLINYKPTYGNIEAVRTLLLLNQILPKMDKNITLGNLQVMSLHSSGQGSSFNMESFFNSCVNPIIEVANGFQEMNIKNNFIGIKKANPFDTLLQTYNATVSGNLITSADRQQLLDAEFDNLSNAKNTQAKLRVLREIESYMRQQWPTLGQGNLKYALKSMSNKNIGNLYKLVLQAIAYYDVTQIVPVEQKMSYIDRNMMITSRIPSYNVRIVTDLYTRSINKIAEQTMEKWKPIRTMLFKFYDDVNYTRFQNSTLGGQAKIFDNLFKRDKNGNKLLTLLNPYDDNDMAQITEDRDIRRQFLKRILFEFAKVKYPMRGIKFEFNSAEDSRLQKFIEEHSDTYFNIPLKKASISTIRQTINPFERAKRLINQAVRLAKREQSSIDEQLVNIFTEEEKTYRDQDRRHMQLRNQFLIGEGDLIERQNYIDKYGVDFFETNLESLLADFIERDIEVTELNKALITIKTVLFQLDLLKANPNQRETIDTVIKTIQDFMDVNFFNVSIMENTSQKIIGATTPLRKLVTNTLIAGNVVSAVRDTFEGLWQNCMRSITHFQTDISKSSLAKAYATVVKNSFSDGRSITIISQLNQMYRLSNIDISRISEGLKSERGITNIKNWAYSTLRRPDFLNRMVLFVAKCYEDGTYDAFDIKDGELVYDWTKDKRFSIYASGNTNDPRYYDQMGAYYNAVREYNQDHPEAPVDYKDGLPSPYSFKDIEDIKKVANGIYGSYDKSTRMMWEHMAIGTTFGMFTTWMNGIWAIYMTKPGQYSGTYTLKQRLDSQGRRLFFDDIGQSIVEVKDDNGNTTYYYEGTNQVAEMVSHVQPQMDKIPNVIQGVYYTLCHAAKLLCNKDLTGFKDELWLDPHERKNLLKFLSDLLALSLFAFIFGYALDPAYKEFKKTMKERNAIVNIATEVLYKGSSRSYDGFKSLYNIFDFIGENTDPPIYKQPIKLLKDSFMVLCGEKSVSTVLNGNVAIFRFAQDTWRASEKK